MGSLLTALHRLKLDGCSLWQSLLESTHKQPYNLDGCDSLQSLPESMGSLTAL